MKKKVEKKKTSFLITESLAYMTQEILNVTEIPRTLLHKRAFAEFLEGDQVVNERLKITNRKDPRYVHRTHTESIYLEPEQEVGLAEAALKNGCGITLVMFQALMDYCTNHADVLDREVLDTIIYGTRPEERQEEQ